MSLCIFALNKFKYIMGLFDKLFGKKEKEDLNKGLEKTNISSM